MKNIFDFWNRQKKRIDAKNQYLFFRERDVFWMQMGKNIGFEQDGKGAELTRPVLIFKKFSAKIFLGIPLSKIEKSGKWFFHFTIPGQSFPQRALIFQMRTFDGKRLRKKIGKISKDDFSRLKKEITRLLSE